MTKKNILLLDNSERITCRMKLMLLNNKYVEKVAVAHTIAWAEDILSKMKTDLIILDIKFSDGNGIIFLTALKKLFPKINLVVLTNYADNYHRTYAKKIGADFFIDKSMAFQEMPQVLSKII